MQVIRRCQSGCATLSAMRVSLLARLCGPCGSLASSVWSNPHRSNATSSVITEKRQSRRRYAADNTNGRVSRAKELIDEMKTKDSAGAKALFEGLMPRDKLDVMRLLQLKRTKRRRERKKSHRLPRYWSRTFERRYYFREEDVTEQSTLGRGPGGQATNRRMQTIILTHVPSGLIVKFSRFTSLWLNRRAARELLNLRLEEKLLGKDSELGRAKAKKEKQSRRNLEQRERLVVKGTVLAARDTQQREFYAVLAGDSALPQRAVVQLGMTERQQPLFVKDLFDGECQSWWPLLFHAFAACLPPQATDGGGGQRGNTEEVSEKGTVQVPLLLQYLFPLPVLDSSHVSRFEQAQLEKCRQDEKALDNVRRAFRCFCELFGFRLVDVTKQDGSVKLVLTKDGLNWLELHRRMLRGGEGRMSPPVLAAWRHIYASLTALGLLSEAQCLRSFFVREAKRARKKNTPTTGAAAPDTFSWAADVVAVLKD